MCDFIVFDGPPLQNAALEQQFRMILFVRAFLSFSRRACGGTKKKNTKRHMFKVLAKTYVFTRAATSTCLKKTQKNKFFMFLEFGTNAIKSHRFGVGLAPRQELQDIVRNWF